jgi:MFS family permease
VQVPTSAAARGRRLPRIRIGALGLVTIVAYGVAYYSYGALIDPIKTSTGWSSTGLGAAFSTVLVLGGAGGLFGGRLVDRLGTRPAFLIAATLGAGSIAAASLAHSLLAFGALYAIGGGAISALGFYHITQPPASLRSATGSAQTKPHDKPTDVRPRSPTPGKPRPFGDGCWPR